MYCSTSRFNQTNYNALFSERPRANIYENEREVVLELEMPGVLRQDIRLELKGEELIVSGERKGFDVPEGYTSIVNERESTSYVRAFCLSSSIDRNNITARFENGVLRVTLLKSEEAQAKRIEIKEA